MAIGWAHSDGTSGVYDSPTEAVMEQQVNTKTKTDREELPPQERINQAFGEGPTPELKDQNSPNSWGMGEEMKSLGTLPDAPDSEWTKEYGSKRAGEVIPISASGVDTEIWGKEPEILTPKQEDVYRKIHRALKENYQFSGSPDEVGWFEHEREKYMTGKPLRELSKDPYLMSPKELREKGVIPQSAPSSKGIGSDYIGGKQSAIEQLTIHEQLASFQERLNNTPPEEAGEFRKFLGSLNIMPAPGKPESEWTAKEHLGVMLNQAMAGMGGGFKAPPRGPVGVVPPKTVITPAIEQLAKYEELSSQGKTTKQITKATKLDPEQVREALGRDNLAIAAFNSENALTNAYFKSLENLDPALGEALKKQVSVKDLKRYTRGLPEERLKTIFEELPSHVKEAFESGEQRRINIDAGKKSKVIPKPFK